MFTNIVFLIDNSSQLGNWLLLAVAYLVGKRMAQGRSKVQARGRAAAGLAFAAYVVAALYTYGQPDSMLLADILYRGVLSAGVVLGFAWMTLATIDIALSPAIRRIRNQIASLKIWWRVRKAQRAEQRRRQEWQELEKHRITEENRPETPLERQDRLERERLAAEREEKALERRVRLREIEGVKERIRYEANLLHKKALRPGKTFKRSDFDNLLEAVLEGDDVTQIEARAAQLLDSLGRPAAAGQQATANQSLEELAANFEQRRQAVREMAGVDDEYKNFLVTAINREEGQAVQRHLRSV